MIGLDLRQLTDPEVLRQTRYAQPALFVIEYALARLWMEWGVQPAAMLGHSSGEIVAACLAGVFSFEDAIAVVAARAAAMQDCPGGAMLAVNLPDEELSALPPGISLAARNAPGMAVVSGSHEAMYAFEQALGRRGVPCRRLNTSHAYHSELMDAALGPFSRGLSRVRLSPPRLRFLSCVTGEWIRPEQATDPNYWVSQLRRTVRFDDGVRAAAALPRPVFLEAGPMQALSKIARAHQVYAVPSLSEQGGSDDIAILQALGELWNRGVRVDWTAFHQGEQRRRTPLPTYAFERRRYWYDESRPVSLSSQSQPGPYYLPSWKLAAPVSALPPRDISNPGGWLFFLDDVGLGQKLSESFRQSGASVVTVTAGEQFERIAEDVFRLPPGDRTAYGKLLGMLRNSAPSLPHTVVHLGSVTGPRDGVEERETVLATGFDSLLLLASEAGAISWTPYLFAITNRAWRLSVHEALEPAKAAACGILRVAPLEQPGFECRQIDVEPYELGRIPGALIEALGHELVRSSPDAVVALRGGRRWVQTLERMTLGKMGAQSSGAFPERGVYLITGGFGELGLQVAAWLIQNRKARIALLGRHSQPLSSALQHDEVLAIEADVSSPDQVKAALDLVETRFGAIDAVLHLAGVPGAGFIQTKTLAAARAVLSPKLEGALTLAHALRERGRRTLVLFSSTFSLAGGLGQVDYCAANACLDAVAHLENSDAMRVLSVNWDGWQSGKWQRQLVSVIPEVHSELEKQRMQSGIVVDEAMPALEQMLAAGLVQAVFSKQDFPALLAGARATSHSLLQRLSAARSSHANTSGPDANGPDRPFVNPRTPTETAVSTIWSEVLGIAKVGATDDFLALGGHSLFAIQIAGRLRMEFQVELGMREMLECQTVADVAAAIDRKRGPQDMDDIYNLLDEISSLSEEDVREQLRKAGNP